MEPDTDSLTFNPFHINLDSDITNDNIFNDSMSDVLSTANSVLSSCNYQSIQGISQQDISTSIHILLL